MPSITVRVIIKSGRRIKFTGDGDMTEEKVQLEREI